MKLSTILKYVAGFLGGLVRAAFSKNTWRRG